jgi:hypothetical protein
LTVTARRWVVGPLDPDHLIVSLSECRHRRGGETLPVHEAGVVGGCSDGAFVTIDMPTTPLGLGDRRWRARRVDDASTHPPVHTSGARPAHDVVEACTATSSGAAQSCDGGRLSGAARTLRGTHE